MIVSDTFHGLGLSPNHQRASEQTINRLWSIMLKAPDFAVLAVKKFIVGEY